MVRIVESLSDDDASAVIVYALESGLHKSVETALYSARRVYEAIDACLGIDCVREDAT